MTSAAQLASDTQSDWRSMVRSGVIVGAVTAAGVVLFALLSRVMSGTSEIFVQSLLVVLGGAVIAYLPSVLLRPRDVDTIAWAAMIGLLGALVFTVIDTIVLRPVDLYHWTWDAIGGGSGFWYVSVWWMSAAFLAWLGAWMVAKTSKGGEPNVIGTAAQTIGIGVVVSLILMVTGVVPVNSAGFALGFTLGLVLHIPLSGVMRKE